MFEGMNTSGAGLVVSLVVYYKILAHAKTLLD